MSFTLAISFETGLEKPDVDEGFVTRLSFIVTEGAPDNIVALGHVFLLHRAAAINASDAFDEACDAHSQSLHDLHCAFFEEEDDDREFHEATQGGHDVLYIDELTLTPGNAGRNIEHALVARLEELFAGVGLIVADAAPHNWTAAGLKPDPSGAYVYLETCDVAPRLEPKPSPAKDVH